MAKKIPLGACVSSKGNTMPFNGPLISLVWTEEQFMSQLIVDNS